MLHHNVVQSVLRRILGHDGDCQNDRDVVASFFGQNVAAVEFPEIGVPGAFHGSLHGAGAGVVGGHREVPIAELVVEIFQVAGGGACGSLGILAIVDPHVVAKPVSASPAGHKLPDAAGADPRNCQRMESGLGLREIDQILRDALLFEGGDDHVVVAARAGKSAFEDAASVA